MKQRSPGRRTKRNIFCGLAAALLLTAAGSAVAQDRGGRRPPAPPVQPGGEYSLGVNHSECIFLGPERERYLETGLNAVRRDRFALARQTTEITKALGGFRTLDAAPDSGQTERSERLEELPTIDRHLFQAMRESSVAPAATTNDYEFARRVFLDLTGRVPPVEDLLAFTGSTKPNKRAELIGRLLETGEWVDRWTMYFGDLFRNARLTAQINRYPEGRDAFHRWIRESLQRNKPYNQMASELVTAAGGNSWQQGELNWMAGGLVMGGPRSGQDHYDQQAANIAETFLGMSHMDCILCHDGRGHLDTLSLWGGRAARYEAWELAAFLSRTVIRRNRVEVNGATRRYYSVNDMRFRNPYPLNTETGNRPPRRPIGAITNVEPRYPFSGGKPADGETYRAALARELTADFQFARALVNYIWKEFFGLGLVEPANQFDPLRLDPDNPPPAPWTLQPNQPRLLNALAQDFIDSGYDLKALMRQIANSEAYQLSSRYGGDWKPGYEPLYARKYVRRLWAEEIHDAVAQTSGLLPTYRMGSLGYLNWAMQFPETARMPNARSGVTVFLDAFMRGDRDQEPRRGDGSAVQALQLMNNSYVIDRCRAAGYGEFQSLARKAFHLGDAEAVDLMFLTILSRHPSAEERNTALGSLQGGDRENRLEDLQWALYNKVDFIFNY